jgi:hypothetical protein
MIDPAEARSIHNVQDERTGSLSVSLKRSIAKGFAAEVERPRGPKSGGSSSTKTKLVEAKLGMVRAAWLLQHVGIVRRLFWLDRANCVQRDEIH